MNVHSGVLLTGVNGEMRRIYIPHYLFTEYTASGEKQIISHVIDLATGVRNGGPGKRDLLNSCIHPGNVLFPIAIQMKNRSVSGGSHDPEA